MRIVELGTFLLPTRLSLTRLSAANATALSPR